MQSNEIKYKKPNLGTRRYFNRYVKIIHNFAHHYNEAILAYNSQFEAGDERREKLIKSHHEQAIYTLLRYYNLQLEKLPRKVYGYKYEDLPPLQMNNVKLANALHKSKATVWRYIKFLCKIGIIKSKKFHGTTADYELTFNPDFILLYDQQNPEIEPVSKYFYEISENDKISFCKPYREYTSSVNNKITDVDKSQKIANFQNSTEKNGVLRTSTKNPYKIPPNIEKVSAEEQAIYEKKSSKISKNQASKDDKQTESNAKKDIAARNKELREYYANMLFIYAVNHLWPGGYLWTDRNGKERFISKAEERRTREYIADTWFKNFNKRKMDEWMRKVYEPGVRRSESILRNKKYENWFVNPRKYFDENNHNGFVGALRFIYKDEKIAKIHKREKEYQDTIANALDEYLDSPKPRKMITILARLKNKQLPEKYIKEFLIAVQKNAIENGNKSTFAESLPNDFKKIMNKKIA